MRCEALTDILANKAFYEAASNFRLSWSNPEIQEDYYVSFGGLNEFDRICSKTDEQLIDYFFEKSDYPTYQILSILKNYKVLKNFKPFNEINLEKLDWDSLVDAYYAMNKFRMVGQRDVLYSIYVFRFMHMVTWENPYKLLPFGERMFDCLRSHYEY